MMKTVRIILTAMVFVAILAVPFIANAGLLFAGGPACPGVGKQINAYPLNCDLAQTQCGNNCPQCGIGTSCSETVAQNGNFNYQTQNGMPEQTVIQDTAIDCNLVYGCSVVNGVCIKDTTKHYQTQLKQPWKTQACPGS